MAVIAGWSAKVQIGGTSTAFTAEAMALFSGSNPTAVYQMSTAAKQYWDPDTAVVIKDGVTTLTEGTNYEIESYLYGRIRFLSYSPVGAITAGGSYLPMWEVDRAHEVGLDWGADMLDASVFGTQFRKRKGGLYDVELSCSRFEMGSKDYDTGAGSKKFRTLVEAGTTVFFEVQFGTGGGSARLAAKLNADNIQTSVDGLTVAALTAQLAAVKAGAGLSFSAFAL